MEFFRWWRTRAPLRRICKRVGRGAPIALRRVRRPANCTKCVKDWRLWNVGKRTEALVASLDLHFPFEPSFGTISIDDFTSLPLRSLFNNWQTAQICQVSGSGRLFCSILFRIARNYPVVIINWVQYLGPPGPFSFPDSRDLLEVLGGLSWQRERGGP